MKTAKLTVTLESELFGTITKEIDIPVHRLDSQEPYSAIFNQITTSLKDIHIAAMKPWQDYNLSGKSYGQLE